MAVSGMIVEDVRRRDGKGAEANATHTHSLTHRVGVCARAEGDIVIESGTEGDIESAARRSASEIMARFSCAHARSPRNRRRRADSTRARRA